MSQFKCGVWGEPHQEVTAGHTREGHEGEGSRGREEEVGGVRVWAHRGFRPTWEEGLGTRCTATSSILPNTGPRGAWRSKRIRDLPEVTASR